MATLLCIHSAKQVNNNRNLTISTQLSDGIFFTDIYSQQSRSGYLHWTILDTFTILEAVFQIFII